MIVSRHWTRITSSDLFEGERTMDKPVIGFNKIELAKDGVVSCGRKRGLAECVDMDEQLARVASAKFADVHVGLLDEIFQSGYFCGLLGIRR